MVVEPSTTCTLNDLVPCFIGTKLYMETPSLHINTMISDIEP